MTGFIPEGTRQGSSCTFVADLESDYTLVPYGKKGWASDNDRFGGLGNSMAVPVMRWIGMRLLEATA